jgi:hypothetical protein
VARRVHADVLGGDRTQYRKEARAGSNRVRQM